MMKKRFAFTLGEVLIALGVIGVVASLVLPQLIIGQKAATARAQFDTAYSLIAKTISDMDADDVSIDPNSYIDTHTFHPKVKKYLKLATDCGIPTSGRPNVNSSICIGFNDISSRDRYKKFSGSNFGSEEIALLDDGCVVLTNGMLMCFENYNKNARGLMFVVDINGKNKNPNRLGYDVFAFELIKDGQVLPVGATGTGISGSQSKNWWGKINATTKDLDAANVKSYCNRSDNKQFSGITCAYYAATDTDYFKKLYNNH